MKRAVVVALFLLLGAAGCQKQVKGDGAVCSDSPEVHCVGQPVCSLDRERGCKMCQCEEVLLDDSMNLDEPPDSTPVRPPE